MTARFKDYRQRRKRFDGDEMDAPRGFGGPPSGQRPAWSPQPPARSAEPMPYGPILTGTVKWFNPEKGFGFVEMDDAEGDVFLHVAVLESSGRKSVAPGAKLECRVGAGTKGRQVTEVVSVDESEAQPDAGAGARRAPPRAGGFGAGGGAGGGFGGGGRGSGEFPPGTVFIAFAGNVNTGGGGGGGAYPPAGNGDGKTGGSGVAIFAHPIAYTATSNITGSNTVVTSDGNVYYTFTGPGTITFTG